MSLRLADEEIELFYEEIEEKMAKVHKKYLLVIQCDWNAIVGNSNDEWRYVVGKFALEKTIQEVSDSY